MGAVLKLRITDIGSSSDQGFLGFRYTDGLDIYSEVRWFWVPERTQPFEATKWVPSLNAEYKRVMDLDIVPSGEWITYIDDYYVYLESLVPERQFSPYIWFNMDMVFTAEMYYNGVPPNPVEFIQGVPSGALLNAYNDNVLLFNVNRPKLDIDANTFLSGTLYPSPLGLFYLNLKEYSAPLINQNEFRDQVNPDIETLGYSYPDPSLFLEIILNMTEGGFSQTAQFYFLKSVAQIANYAEKNISNDYILIPNGRVTYYEGYPFDISLFSSASREITILNKTTGHSVAMDVERFTNRIFFSQGSENFTIDDVMPMQSGINRLEIQFSPDSKLDLIVNKVPSQCAPYFKFYRNSGGFGYIRFEKENSEQLKTREGLKLRSDFTGIQNTSRRSISDKTTTLEMEFQTESLESWEMENFKDFIGSPRVEMYVSDLFQRQTDKSWIGVNVKSSTLNAKKLKTSKSREQVTVEIDLYNLHL